MMHWGGVFSDADGRLIIEHKWKADEMNRAPQDGFGRQAIKISHRWTKLDCRTDERTPSVGKTK